MKKNLTLIFKIGMFLSLVNIVHSISCYKLNSELDKLKDNLSQMLTMTYKHEQVIYSKDGKDTYVVFKNSAILLRFNKCITSNDGESYIILDNLLENETYYQFDLNFGLVASEQIFDIQPIPKHDDDNISKYEEKYSMVTRELNVIGINNRLIDYISKIATDNNYDSLKLNNKDILDSKISNNFGINNNNGFILHKFNGIFDNTTETLVDKEGKDQQSKSELKFNAQSSLDKYDSYESNDDEATDSQSDEVDMDYSKPPQSKKFKITSAELESEPLDQSENDDTSKIEKISSAFSKQIDSMLKSLNPNQSIVLIPILYYPRSIIYSRIIISYYQTVGNQRYYNVTLFIKRDTESEILTNQKVTLSVGKAHELYIDFSDNTGADKFVDTKKKFNSHKFEIHDYQAFILPTADIDAKFKYTGYNTKDFINASNIKYDQHFKLLYNDLSMTNYDDFCKLIVPSNYPQRIIFFNPFTDTTKFKQIVLTSKMLKNGEIVYDVNLTYKNNQHKTYKNLTSYKPVTRFNKYISIKFGSVQMFTVSGFDVYVSENI